MGVTGEDTVQAVWRGHLLDYQIVKSILWTPDPSNMADSQQTFTGSSWDDRLWGGLHQFFGPVKNIFRQQKSCGNKKNFFYFLPGMVISVMMRLQSAVIIFGLRKQHLDLEMIHLLRTAEQAHVKSSRDYTVWMWLFCSIRILLASGRTLV